jgi:transposase
MSWKQTSIIKERERFAILALQKKQPLAELCRQFGISRPVGYKWRERFAEQGRRGLCDRRRGPKQAAQPQAQRWQRRVLALRRAHRHWGAAKIRVKLAEKYGARGLPAMRTLARWFAQAGLSRKPPRRARRGPAVAHPGLTRARRRHQVWTVDFKGWYRTADGQRQEPLTVRDFWTRYVLAVRLLPDQSDVRVRAALARVFAQHGLPEIIRVDNGSPFGGIGTLRLTRLSVWWLRLGIGVEFTRRARPGDNAAHEQMHGVYAREVAADPGANRRSEQRRAERWRQQYNQQRPHAALRQRPPGVLYARSPRAYPSKLAEWVYPKLWSVRRVRSHGDIKWQGRLRFIGRAFVGERVGLQLLAPGQWVVYLGPHLIGHLHSLDPSGLRPAFWQRAPTPSAPKPSIKGGAPSRIKCRG